MAVPRFAPVNGCVFLITRPRIRKGKILVPKGRLITRFVQSFARLPSGDPANPRLSVVNPQHVRKLLCVVNDGKGRGPIAWTGVNDVWHAGYRFAARICRWAWKITEFRLPITQVRVTLGADGRWQVAADPLKVVAIPRDRPAAPGGFMCSLRVRLSRKTSTTACLYVTCRRHFWSLLKRRQQFRTLRESEARYRRQDEAATRRRITVDGETLQNGSVTIRDRDSLRQWRVKAEECGAGAAPADPGRVKNGGVKVCRVPCEAVKKYP